MEPLLTFAFNYDGTSPWSYRGDDDPEIDGWKTIDTSADTLVITGGGILGTLPTPTCASGTRDATIRPSVTSYVIPQTYIEKPDMMYNAPLVGHNTNRYAMGVHVNGSTASDLYLEAWDSHDFSTTNLEILTGTTNSSFNSFINAIRTTDSSPPWHPGWSGSDSGAAYLRGTEFRVGLNNSSVIENNEIVYYNMYIRLPTDCSTFHAQPVLAFRYLYS